MICTDNGGSEEECSVPRDACFAKCPPGSDFPPESDHPHRGDSDACNRYSESVSCLASDPES